MPEQTTILLNGEDHPIELPCTVSKLIEQLGFNRGRIAVELNKEILPRSEHESTELAAQDRVEVIHAIGGG